jgi:hypothetical protein
MGTQEKIRNVIELIGIQNEIISEVRKLVFGFICNIFEWVDVSDIVNIQ